jgi:predicted dehydrogenase
MRRRQFLKATLMGSGAALGTAQGRAQTTRHASQRIRLGVMGLNGMGRSHVRTLAGMPEAQVVYLCDVDENLITPAAKELTDQGRPLPQTVKDFRRILDDKSIDALVIATPDHWHASATIMTCQAGKHVYVEKPASHNLREGRLMIEAARRHGRVVQVGTQSRSTAHVVRAMQLLHEGAIGKVLVAKAWNSQFRGSIGHESPSAPPAGLDYDLWVGPAPMMPYRKNIVHSNWRWWYDFGVGDIGNDGVHDIDLARWGLGVKNHQSRIAALGSKSFYDDDQQWPDTQTVVFEYSGRGAAEPSRQLVYEQRIWSPYFQEGFENGNAFYGTQGMMLLGKKEGFQLFGPRNQLRDEMKGGLDLPAHHRNFLHCVRSNERPSADIEIGHLSSSLCHLANIATRTGRTLNFDPAAEQVTGDKEANALLKRSYRDGHWAVPVGV